MRTHKSIKNVLIAIIMNIVTVSIGLVSQKIFVKCLGSEYLGINGLFTNIVSMLGFVELGIGAAIIYNLYEPIAHKDNEKIKSLMEFYKISYRTIAIIVLALGLILMLFLPSITGEVTIKESLYVIYLIYLLEVVFSYCLSYKRSLIYANQENYVINIVHIIYLIILNVLQFIVLIFTKNFYLYLIIKIIMRVIENVVLTILANRMYPILKENNILKLDLNTRKDIFKKVKALLFHKVGSYVVLGTDNIIISKMFGIITVGLYSNYSMIINTLNNFVMQLFTSLTASVGNLLTLKDKKKNFEIYKKIRFLSAWISSFFAISFYVCIQDFMKIWLGSDYIMDTIVILSLSINTYLTMYRYNIMSFKEAAGIFYEDRFMPLFEAAINLLVSIVFGIYFGVVGIFIGTIFSNLFLHLYSYYKYIYKNLFETKGKEYYYVFFKNLFTFVVLLFITKFVSEIIIFNNSFLHLLYCVLCSLLIPNLLMFLLYLKNDSFCYYKTLFLNILRNKKIIYDK